MESDPTVPQKAHVPPPVKYTDIDIESLQPSPQKRPMKTFGDYGAEWKYGSKMRVVKHIVLSMGLGIIVGGIAGTIIGVCVRFA